MPIRFACPFCKKTLIINDAMGGKKVRCGQCNQVTMVPVAATPLTRPPVTAGAGRTRDVDDRQPTQNSRRDDEDDERPGRKRNKSGMGLVVLGLGALLLVSVSVGVTILVMGGHKSDKLIAKGPDAPNAVVQQPQPEAPKQPVFDPFERPDPQAPANPQVNKAPPPSAPAVAKNPESAPQPDPQPPVNPQPGINAPPPAPVQPPKNVNPAELYGDQGGEQVAAADPGLPATVMRARRDDTFYKLSNPRIGAGTAGKGTVKALLVDYQVHRRGKFNDGKLVLRADEGVLAEVVLNSLANRDSGTFQLVAPQSGKFNVQAKGSNFNFYENVEIYMTRGDYRYDPPSNHMVSNTVVMGNMKTTTRARDWTPDEIARYSKAPSAYKSPNSDMTTGEDIPLLSSGLGLKRYVDPDGRLLGLDYTVRDYENRPSLMWMAPVFSPEQPRQYQNRLIARNGYAVAGAQVNKDKYVYGIRFLFQRVNPDGSFDAKDAYAGDWIGVPPEGREPTTLVNDGRRVLGIHFQEYGAICQFSLVAKAK